jgi:tetratricopeptide (TPR) repeat protein
MDILSIVRAPQDPSPTATPADLRAAFFSRLAKRDLAGAEALLPRFGGAETRNSELHEGLRRVRAVLSAAADELLTLAEASRKARRFDDADAFVARAFAQVPGHPRARVVAAAILADRGRPDEALAALDAVLELPAPPPEARLRRGQILAARRDGAADAQREFELFLTLSPENDPLRAEARAALESITARRNAVRVRELQSELALARDRGADEKVIEIATAIQALAPTDARSLLALGDAFAETGRPHDAFLAYRRLADGRPFEREWPKAAAALRKLEQRYPALPRDRETAAATPERLARREVVEAREAVDDVLTRAPFLEDALAGGAEAWLARKGSGTYALQDDPRRALRLTEILLLRNPGHVRGMELRAEALLRTGAPKEALELATKATELDPMRPDPATTAGFACLALGDADAALVRFQSSLSRRRTPQALYGRVLAWEELGRRPAARDEALTLLEEFGIPDDMTVEVEGLLARLDLEFVRRPK